MKLRTIKSLFTVYIVIFLVLIVCCLFFGVSKMWLRDLVNFMEHRVCVEQHWSGWWYTKTRSERGTGLGVGLHGQGRYNGNHGRRHRLHACGP